MPGWSRSAVFFQQLAVLLDAGMDASRAVELAGATAGGEFIRLGAGWSQAAQAGRPLSGAMAADGLPAHACALVRAGEAGGRLPDLCRQLAASYELRVRLRTQAISRLVYPVILLHVALLVPALPAVVLGQAPAWRLLLGPFILYAVVGGLWAVGATARRKGALARLGLAWPLSGLVWPALMADAAAVLRAGLSAGMLASDAVDLAAAACANRVVAERLRLAAVGLRDGRVPDLTAAMREAGLPAGDLALISAAERSGRLEDGLAQLRTVNGERFAFRLDWACRIATGTIYAISLIAAALTVIGMYQKIYLAPMQELLREAE